MTDSRVSPQEFITGLLRANITDPNATARTAAGLSANWIYPDRPLLSVLVGNENNFPRISVTRMDTSSMGDIGMNVTETEDTVTLLVNAYTIKTKPLLDVNTVTNESHTCSQYSADITSGETYSASAEYLTNTVDKLFDDTSDYWVAVQGPTPVGHWAKVDYGAGDNKTVSKITIKNRGANLGINGFILQGSNNDSDWSDVYTGNATNDSVTTTFTFSNTTEYRYYRIYCSSGYSVNTLRIEEIEMMEAVDVYTLDETPVTGITEVTGTLSSAAHTFVETTDYLLIDNDSDGRYDSIDWSPGGDDPDDTTDFYVDYVRKLEGDTLSEYLCDSVHIYLRDNWRTDTVPTLFDYINVRKSSIMDEIGGRIKRCELQIKFTGININD